MANPLDDKKNRTTEQPAAASQQPHDGRNATPLADEGGDTSTIDRDAGNLEHGETGGHPSGTEEG